MTSPRGRGSKVISIRLPDEQLQHVHEFLEASEQQTLTGAVQHLIALGLGVQAESDYEEHRRSVGAAGMAQLAHERQTDAFRVVRELSEAEPFAARKLAIELLTGASELVRLINDEADARLLAAAKRKGKK